MFTGIIVNGCVIVAGGLCGGLFGHIMPDKVKHDLTAIFGVCSIGMGVQGITSMQHMSPVILAVVMGTLVGLVCRLGYWVEQGAGLMQKMISRWFTLYARKQSEEQLANLEAQLLTIIVLFCASGMGIYGSLEAGITGDATILITKSILDFFTAFIFACNLGYVVSLVAVPQITIFSLIALSATIVMPFTTPAMIGDLRACGGFLMIATGLRILQLKLLPTADMIPAMVLVLPFSWAWLHWLAPLLAS